MLPAFAQALPAVGSSDGLMAVRFDGDPSDGDAFYSVLIDQFGMRPVYADPANDPQSTLVCSILLPPSEALRIYAIGLSSGELQARDLCMAMADAGYTLELPSVTGTD